MELHKHEIVKKDLLKTAFLNAKLGPEGHPWESIPSPAGAGDR